MSKTLTSLNPATREILGEVQVSSEEEIKAAVQKANTAKKIWKEMSATERVSLLRKLSQAFHDHSQEIAELITAEMGMPIAESLDDMDWGLEFFDWYLDHAEEALAPEQTREDETSIHTVFREPIGTAAVIAPWNFPFSNIIGSALMCLIAGNTVVLKHSEETPLSGKLLEDIILSIGLPEGVFSEIYGDGEVGDLLVHQDIDLICFTGSSAVGKRLYKVAAEKFIPAIMELGGSAPALVFEDVDLEKVLENITWKRILNCGQCCTGLKRLLVHESRLEEVTEKLKIAFDSLRIGDPKEKTTQVGPLVAERQLESLKTQVQDALQKGARLITGGKSPEGLPGFFYEPTLLDNITPDMAVWNQETFGPVLPIVSFSSEEEAVQLANDTVYGLGAYIYTEDQERAKRVAAQIDSGMVSLNTASTSKPCNPFGGYKESGLGRQHGKYGFHDVTQLKAVALEKK